MLKTVVHKNESLDDALRHLKRSMSKAGTLQEPCKCGFYERPDVRRKKKSEAARKRRKFQFCDELELVMCYCQVD